MNSTLVHRIGAITFEDILEIHRRVLGYVDLFEGGRLRTTQGIFNIFNDFYYFINILYLISVCGRTHSSGAYRSSDTDERFYSLA